MVSPIAYVSFFLMYCLQRNDAREIGELSFYPLHRKVGDMQFYVLGSWMWIFVPLWLASSAMNGKYNDWCHRNINGSSYFTYFLHYPLLMMDAVFIKDWDLPYRINIVILTFMMYAELALIWWAYQSFLRCCRRKKLHNLG